MPWFDISVSVGSNTPLYPGDLPPVVTRASDVAKGDACSKMHLEISNHHGTHVDAPMHFIPGGKTLNEFPIESFQGPCTVAELDSDLTSIKTDKILFKSGGKFLTPGMAEQLVKLNVRLVGIDQLSVDPLDSEHFPVHKILLGHNILILETVDLTLVPPGPYHLSCFPLKLEDADGSPVRAVLSQES